MVKNHDGALIFGALSAFPPVMKLRFGGLGAAGLTPRRTSSFGPAIASCIGANCTTVNITASQALGRFTLSSGGRRKSPTGPERQHRARV
jgi:hypothetical protein